MKAMIRAVAFCAGILLSIATVEATQFSTDETDLYWNPNESGWGMQVVQEADTIFVTLYVYDQSGNPIWYVATGTWQGNFVWVGELFQTTGPWLGTPVFNPGSVTATKVGTLTFDASTSVNKATLIYSVNGVVVTKQVERQTLKNDTYAGTYVGQFKNVLTCADPTQNGTVIVPVTLTVLHQGSTAFTMITTGSAATCTYAGIYSQTGRFGNVNGGTYTCTDGASGTFNSFEMYVNVSGFTARANINNASCTATSHFGGMRQ